MKIRLSSLITPLLFTLSMPAFAGEDANASLQAEREQVIQRYVADLQAADYKNIAQLFEANGFVISTSRGKVNAKDFFYAFLPNVLLANTALHQAFASHADSNRYAARFHLDFKLKDGETDTGEYMDEFVFVNNSAKLSAVYMFENLKFEDS